jgi:hypothetical protein
VLALPAEYRDKKKENGMSEITPEPTQSPLEASRSEAVEVTQQPASSAAEEATVEDDRSLRVARGRRSRVARVVDEGRRAGDGDT